MTHTTNMIASAIENLHIEELNSMQLDAIDSIEKNQNTILLAPTGSGKTIVAALASAIVNESGAQSAIMAPTSILAEQHYRTFETLLVGENAPLKPGQIRLLVGDTPEAEKQEAALVRGRHSRVPLRIFHSYRKGRLAAAGKSRRSVQPAKG